ncbi:MULTISPECIES: hypothetical protein [unclassified Undibacterium]|uniref:hypothetical protein n=1 Tax=unclassified Undibacterium TaxID=2630295 RepID=UPI002AC97A18|nr:MULTISPECIES: hypothetical protein [unclassified Undibacterium]MEB0137537.1 hypothetical protein [Undibacterium sp. CCC2.1]MEB0170798.1 hypothetical protein [Undibacterium sp. CCC1.1]MEB0174750.1 hypothetical protein [Undibacterium sp. CCC3.4]WPX44402.1 hypothetical protein RHM61_03980 [Undibacterium sp. CCC3.4]
MMTYFRVLMSLLVLSLLTACGGGGGSPGATSPKAPLYTTAAANVTILPGTSQSYIIGGGVSPYFVSSSTGAATVTLTGNGTNMTINAVGTGSSQITVTDSAGTKLTINATLSTGLPLSSNLVASVLPIGTISQKYYASGGTGQYAVVSSNTSVVSVVFNSDGSFQLQALAVGTANIQVSDGITNLVAVAITVQ